MASLLEGEGKRKILDTFWHMSHSLEETMLTCMFNDQRVKCNELFTREPTDAGESMRKYESVRLVKDLYFKCSLASVQNLKRTATD